MMDHFNMCTPSPDQIPEHYASVEMMRVLQERQRISDHMRKKSSQRKSSRSDGITESMNQMQSTFQKACTVYLNADPAVLPNSPEPVQKFGRPILTHPKSIKLQFVDIED